MYGDETDATQCHHVDTNVVLVLVPFFFISFALSRNGSTASSTELDQKMKEQMRYPNSLMQRYCRHTLSSVMVLSLVLGCANNGIQAAYYSLRLAI